MHFITLLLDLTEPGESSDPVGSTDPVNRFTEVNSFSNHKQKNTEVRYGTRKRRVKETEDTSIGMQGWKRKAVGRDGHMLDGERCVPMSDSSKRFC